MGKLQPRCLGARAGGLAEQRMVGRTHVALWGASKGWVFFPECFKFQRLKTSRWLAPSPPPLFFSPEVSAGDGLPLHFHLGDRRDSKKAPRIFCPHSWTGDVMDGTALVRLYYTMQLTRKAMILVVGSNHRSPLKAEFLPDWWQKSM